MTEQNKVDSDEAPRGYRAEPGPGCEGCAFDDDVELCWANSCTPYFRDDKQHVIFIKKE